MQRALLLVVLVLLGAGCATPQPEPGEAPTAAPDGEAAPAAGPAPLDDGTQPMAADVGHMPHMHDYWAGAERVVLFDGAIDPSENVDPFQNLEPLLVDKQAKAGRTMWHLPDGAIVYEGTGSMDITATWDDPRVTSLAVEYASDATGEFSEPVPLLQATALTIPITPEMTDMPHMSTSRWMFAFETADMPGIAMGPFHLRVEIVRLADVMLFPGHPEHFEGLPEKILEDADHEHAEVSYAKRAPQLATEGGFQEKFVAPSKTVPMETLAMRIELDILEATATPGVVSEIRFFYRGADTSFIGHPTVLPLEGSLAEKRLIYQIPVTMEETDSPYADESQWLFFVEPATKFVGDPNEPDCGGCTDVSIKYHLKIIAYDHELENYSKRENDA